MRISFKRRRKVKNKCISTNIATCAPKCDTTGDSKVPKCLEVQELNSLKNKNNGSIKSSVSYFKTVIARITRKNKIGSMESLSESNSMQMSKQATLSTHSMPKSIIECACCNACAEKVPIELKKELKDASQQYEVIDFGDEKKFNSKKSSIHLDATTSCGVVCAKDPVTNLIFAIYPPQILLPTNLNTFSPNPEDNKFEKSEMTPMTCFICHQCLGQLKSYKIPTEPEQAAKKTQSKRSLTESDILPEKKSIASTSSRSNECVNQYCNLNTEQFLHNTSEVTGSRITFQPNFHPNLTDEHQRQILENILRSKFCSEKDESYRNVSDYTQMSHIISEKRCSKTGLVKEELKTNQDCYPNTYIDQQKTIQSKINSSKMGLAKEDFEPNQDCCSMYDHQPGEEPSTNKTRSRMGLTKENFQPNSDFCSNYDRSQPGEPPTIKSSNRIVLGTADFQPNQDCYSNINNREQPREVPPKLKSSSRIVLATADFQPNQDCYSNINNHEQPRKVPPKVKSSSRIVLATADFQPNQDCYSNINNREQPREVPPKIKSSSRTGMTTVDFQPNQDYCSTINDPEQPQELPSTIKSNSRIGLNTVNFQPKQDCYSTICNHDQPREIPLTIKPNSKMGLNKELFQPNQDYYNTTDRDQPRIISSTIKSSNIMGMTKKDSQPNQNCYSTTCDYGLPRVIPSPTKVSKMCLIKEEFQPYQDCYSDICDRGQFSEAPSTIKSNTRMGLTKQDFQQNCYSDTCDYSLPRVTPSTIRSSCRLGSEKDFQSNCTYQLSPLEHIQPMVIPSEIKSNSKMDLENQDFQCNYNCPSTASEQPSGCRSKISMAKDFQSNYDCQPKPSDHEVQIPPVVKSSSNLGLSKVQDSRQLVYSRQQIRSTNNCASKCMSDDSSEGSYCGCPRRPSYQKMRCQLESNQDKYHNKTRPYETDYRSEPSYTRKGKSIYRYDSDDDEEDKPRYWNRDTDYERRRNSPKMSRTGSGRLCARKRTIRKHYIEVDNQSEESDSDESFTEKKTYPSRRNDFCKRAKERYYERPETPEYHNDVKPPENHREKRRTPTPRKIYEEHIVTEILCAQPVHPTASEKYDQDKFLSSRDGDYDSEQLQQIMYNNCNQIQRQQIIPETSPEHYKQIRKPVSEELKTPSYGSRSKTEYRPDTEPDYLDEREPEPEPEPQVIYIVRSYRNAGTSPNEPHRIGTYGGYPVSVDPNQYSPPPQGHIPKGYVLVTRVSEFQVYSLAGTPNNRRVQIAGTQTEENLSTPNQQVSRGVPPTQDGTRGSTSNDSRESRRRPSPKPSEERHHHRHRHRKSRK